MTQKSLEVNELYNNQLKQVKKVWPDQPLEWQAEHAKRCTLAFIDGYLSVRGKLAQSTQP